MTPTTKAGRALLAKCIETDWWRDPKGYGKRSIKGGDGRYHTVSAHRLAWEQVHGPIPAGLVVMHACDNPPCINLDHLSLGTHADNIADRDAKGRTATGDRNGSRTHIERRPRGPGASVARSAEGTLNPTAKLDEERVRQIRERHAAGETGKAIALSWGLHPTTVQRVINGQRWSHV